MNLEIIDNSWRSIIENALHQLDKNYIHHLRESNDWLPGPERIFNAFALPLEKVNYVLLGESPYPRKISANGYAFWDASIQELWCETGLSKAVNRATSMRNLLKMLLIAEGLLDAKHTTQADIAKIEKQTLVQTNNEFFQKLLQQGFLLLNATLVLQSRPAHKEAIIWRPFIQEVIKSLLEKKPNITFILFGRIANNLCSLFENPQTNKLCAEHPYNVSFISNEVVLNFFKPRHLLKK